MEGFSSFINYIILYCRYIIIYLHKTILFMEKEKTKLEIANETLVERIKEMNLDMVTLAAAVGLNNHNDLYNWRKLKKIYQFDKLEKIATAIGCDMQIVIN